jgi:uroporphyrinogen III methyltransferase/synthase
MTPRQAKGLVVLIGSGPGDIGLVTQAAIDWISRADTIIYDRLANPALLEHARKDAELVYVGKSPYTGSIDQEGINKLIVQHGLAGELVVRLKGGDPFIFGRGGEEVDALLENGIEFRVVPGITSALAAGAYAGIPLTDRRHASSVAFVTGQQDPAKAETTVNWQAVAGIDTVVFYMGMNNLPLIVRELIAAGKDPKTPCAVVQEASTPHQRTVSGPLAEIERIVLDSGIHAPALTIVGGVTTMYPRMAWYEKLPLFGQSVLVTRPAQQAGELERPLVERGAEVLLAPMVEIRPPADQAAMDAALRRLSAYALIVFTSVNGVQAFVRRCRQLGIDARAMGKAKIAAVGAATQGELESNFLHADIVPEKFTTKALAEKIAASPDANWKGKKVLLARADIATAELPSALQQAGAIIDEVDFYASLRPEALPSAAIAAIQDGRLNWITFTSSSAVMNFLELLKISGLSAGLIKNVRIAVIGPVTAQSCEQFLRRPDVMAESHTIEGLIEAITQYVAAK